MVQARNTARALPRGASSQKRLALNVLFGLPDDNRAHISVVDDGRRLSFDLPGTVDIVPHLSPQRFAMRLIYLQPAKQHPVKLGPGPILNHIADADICSRTLELARQIVRKSGRPCFNHPDAIAATTREGVARALTGVPGLDVPKTIRVVSPTPADLRTAIEQGGLKYPVLVRVAGSHGGLTMIKLDDPDAVREIERLDRKLRSALYATEFRDFIGPDGQYRKFRIVVVGDNIFVRHIVMADDWLIHARRRATNSKNEELAMFASFENEHAPRLRPMFVEIARRLDLDFFGVDCALGHSGEMILFEANACMAILGQTQKEKNVKADAIDRIRNAVAERLASPSTWRHFRSRTRTAGAEALAPA